MLAPTSPGFRKGNQKSCSPLDTVRPANSRNAVLSKRQGLRYGKDLPQLVKDIIWAKKVPRRVNHVGDGLVAAGYSGAQNPTQAPTAEPFCRRPMRDETFTSMEIPRRGSTFLAVSLPTLLLTILLTVFARKSLRGSHCHESWRRCRRRRSLQQSKRRLQPIVAML